MKTLKALKNWILGYRLHPKEKMRLYDLWVNIRTVIFTLIVFLFLLWLVDATGCTGDSVKSEHRSEFSE